MGYFSDGFVKALDLLMNADDATISAIEATLVSTSCALAIAMVIGLPLGFGLDVAAQYSQRRMNLNDDASETFKSIEIPLNVRYNIGLGSVASIYLATGPQFGFNVGHRHWSFSDMQETFSMERMNTSWNVGAGVKVLSHLEVGVAYNIALSKYAKHRFQGEDYSFRANTFQVQLAYLF